MRLFLVRLPDLLTRARRARVKRSRRGLALHLGAALDRQPEALVDQIEQNREHGEEQEGLEFAALLPGMRRSCLGDAEGPRALAATVAVTNPAPRSPALGIFLAPR